MSADEYTTLKNRIKRLEHEKRVFGTALYYVAKELDITRFTVVGGVLRKGTPHNIAVVINELGDDFDVHLLIDDRYEHITN